MGVDDPDPSIMIEALTALTYQLAYCGDPAIIVKVMKSPGQVIEDLGVPDCVQGKVSAGQLALLLHEYVRCSLRDGQIALPGLTLRLPPGVGWVWDSVPPRLHLVLPEGFPPPPAGRPRPQTTHSVTHRSHTMSSLNKQSRPQTSVSPSAKSRVHTAASSVAERAHSRPRDKSPIKHFTAAVTDSRVGSHPCPTPQPANSPPKPLVTPTSTSHRTQHGHVIDLTSYETSQVTLVLTYTYLLTHVISFWTHHTC